MHVETAFGGGDDKRTLPFAHFLSTPAHDGVIVDRQRLVGDNKVLVNAEHTSESDWILVHDAARPCLAPWHIETLVHELIHDEVGGILAVPVADTLKREDSTHRVADTVPREGLWQAQTPQMFRYVMLKRALESARNVTDEASAIEAMGLRPRLVRGDPTNLKVTYPLDLHLAEWILQHREGKE